MNWLRSMSSILLTLALTVAVGAGAWWIVTHPADVKKSDKPAPPAKVEKVVKEDDLNTITLTEEAEKRIGLTLGTVEEKSVRRARVYGGEVAVPVGRAILVASPMTGILKAPASGEIKAGGTVKQGQTVFQLTPLLTPDGRATLSATLADVEGQVNSAKAQAELTAIALDRAERVLKDGAGSQRQVDEARAADSIAIRTLDAAKARLTILKKVVGDAESGTSAPIAIESPEAGFVRTVSARSGQTVPSGAALFEVVDLSTAWVRVPLPVGDLDTIDRKQPAHVGKLSDPPGKRLPIAKPVLAPPTANPLSATVDLYYEVPNPDGNWFPGQRLGVSLPLAEAPKQLTVPWSAVVYDIHGGTWVYEQISPHRFVRRRVMVGNTAEADAVLFSGPAQGTKIVTAGVQQLFGAETGFIK
ncbi:MAG: efflux RND transporter periplasmic adaptor subunit [Gemmataceae bacterium]